MKSVRWLKSALHEYGLVDNTERTDTHTHTQNSQGTHVVDGAVLKISPDTPYHHPTPTPAPLSRGSVMITVAVALRMARRYHHPTQPFPSPRGRCKYIQYMDVIGALEVPAAGTPYGKSET